MILPIIVQNSEIIFNYSPDSGSDQRTFTELYSWSTEYGYLIPYDYTSVNLKMFMLTGMIDQQEGVITKGLLLGNDGILRKLAVRIVDSAPVVDVDMIDCHRFNKYVIGTAEAQSHINALFSLGYDNDKILEYLTKHTNINMQAVVKHRVIDILKVQLELCKEPQVFHSSILTRNMPKPKQ